MQSNPAKPSGHLLKARGSPFEGEPLVYYSDPHLLLLRYRIDRTYGRACAAISAEIGVDYPPVFFLAYRFNRAFGLACSAIGAFIVNDMWHFIPPSVK